MAGKITLDKIGLVKLLERTVLPLNMVTSTRAIGDMIQCVIMNEARELFKYYFTVRKDSSHKKLANVIAVKNAHREEYVKIVTVLDNGKHSMPNIISVPRIVEFYAGDSKGRTLYLLVVWYSSKSLHKIGVNRVEYFPIEHLDWDCLGIGNLGRGQIQLSMRKFHLAAHSTRKCWLLYLKQEYTTFCRRVRQRATMNLEIFKDI